MRLTLVKSAHGEVEVEAATVPTNDETIVALIEDNRLVREGLTSLLNRVPDIRVLPEGTGSRLFPGSVLPQVVLLDLGLPNGESLRLAQKIADEFPDARIVVMDLLPSEEDIMEFVAVGVSGFVMKDATLDELLRTIRSVASGVDVLPPPLVSTLFAEIANEVVSSNGVPAALDSVRMTPREREVIDLIAEGKSNKAIGKELHISTHTVKSHLRNIMEKLNLHSRLQIAVYVHEQEAEA